MQAEANTTDRVATVFNGDYTIHSAATGDHRTFRIRTQPDDSRFCPGQRTIALLTGPDNTSSYTPFGFVNDDEISVWRKKLGRDKPSDYEVYAHMLWSLATEGAASRWTAKGFTLMVAGRCIRCNRKLTTPESITRGIGPICAGL